MYDECGVRPGALIMSIEIFTDANFSGNSDSVDSSSAWIGDFWNDKISSIKVHSGTWEFFEHANFQGRSFRLTPGEYPWVTHEWNDMISSLKQVEQGTPSVTSGSGMAQEILNAHNSYRSQVGVPSLTWSDALASDAQKWANYLSANGLFQHSQDRNGQGENLWRGTSGAYSFTQMIQSFGDEKQYFIGGTFPNVSSTGQWEDVGHYTQVVWRNTTEVGCAIATANGNDILVCRYNPSGNFLGQPVF